MASAKKVAKKYGVSKSTAQKMIDRSKANGFNLDDWNSMRITAKNIGMTTTQYAQVVRGAQQAGMTVNEYQRDQYSREYQDQLNQLEMEYNSSEAQKARDFNSAEAQIARDFNSAEAQKARQFNSDEARIAREWETEMSNTAHQREVADLKKAGLNPVLSANGGAQSYTTASANASNASASNATGVGASASLDSAISAIASNATNHYNWKMSKLSNNTNLQIARMNRDVGLAQASASRANAGAVVSAAALSANATKYATDHNKNGNVWGIIQNYLQHPDSAPKWFKKLYKDLRD